MLSLGAKRDNGFRRFDLQSPGLLGVSGCSSGTASPPVETVEVSLVSTLVGMKNQRVVSGRGSSVPGSLLAVVGCGECLREREGRDGDGGEGARWRGETAVGVGFGSAVVVAIGVVTIAC